MPDAFAGRRKCSAHGGRERATAGTCVCTFFLCSRLGRTVTVPSLGRLRAYFTRISTAAHNLVRTSPARVGHTARMQTRAGRSLKAVTLIAQAVAIAAMGIYVANADDAPGA